MKARMLTSHEAATAFAVEQWLAEQDDDDTYFLLWSTAPTIMLGKYQDALAEVNQAYAAAHQLTIVRRNSGGGTIFTDPGSFQYSFIAPSKGGGIDFDRFLDVICQALAKMGVPVRRSSRNDLTIFGRKFSGNAQYNHHGHVVHHGSLLFDSDVSEMSAALHVDPLKLKSKHVASVHQRVANLRECLPDLTPGQFTRQLFNNVKQLAGPVTDWQPDAAEEDEIATIRAERFANPAFIYNQIPQTALTKERYFPGGGLVKLALTVEHGTLTSLHLTGDFFSDLGAGELAASLVGTEFRPATIGPKLTAFLAATPIMNISANDLLELLFS